MKNIIFAICAIAIFTIPQASLANDSEAETALGGLKLKQSKFISLDSEDLYISKDLIRVSYKFTNTSNQDVKTLVSFPLPGIPYDFGQYFEDYNYPYYDDLNFKTLVDGKEIKYQIQKLAEIKGKDVTKRIQNLGFPIDWTVVEDPARTLFTKISAQTKAQMIKEGLLVKLFNDVDDYYPAWSEVIHINREQTFPAGKTISVVHTYKPINGGSVGGSLIKAYRKETIADYQKKYCTDKDFFNAFDKKDALEGKDELYHYETWIGYILKSGANWKGPIKNFRLVVDKGEARNLVSFCMSGVKKISPTQFEVKKTNFEPKQDLNILIVNWGKPE